jgi:hypothetical protein
MAKKNGRGKAENDRIGLSERASQPAFNITETFRVAARDTSVNGFAKRLLWAGANVSRTVSSYRDSAPAQGSSLVMAIEPVRAALSEILA